MDRRQFYNGNNNGAEHLEQIIATEEHVVDEEHSVESINLYL